MEEKEDLILSDRNNFGRIKELAKQFNCEFEECHIEVVNFSVAEDTAALESEEAVFDEHMDCVEEFIKRLEQLEDLLGATEPVMPHASNKGIGRTAVRSISEAEHLSRRLSPVHYS